MSISAATVVTWRLCAEGPVAEVKYAFLWKNAVQIWEPSRNDKEVEFTHTHTYLIPPHPRCNVATGVHAPHPLQHCTGGAGVERDVRTGLGNSLVSRSVPVNTRAAP